MVAWWTIGMEDGMAVEVMEAEVRVVGGDVVPEGVVEGMVVEICSGTQDITTVMIHQDHCLARVVVDVGEDEDVVADLLVKVSDLMVHFRKLLEHLQKYGFKLKPKQWMAAGLYALFKALIANLIGKRPYLLFSRPQILREIGR